MNQRLILSKIIFFLILAFNLPAIAKQNRIALVIGNSAYKDAPLKNPINDARDMATLLTKQGFEVTPLINAKKRDMKEAISAFGKRLYEKNTVGLFFFAGHGIQVSNSNYLIPIGAQIKSEADVEYEAIDAGRVLSQMSQADNGLNMMILDACRNNPFARSFRSSTRGLAKMQAPSGSVILYATSPGDVAADGDGKNGLFTERLMMNINKPGYTVEKVFKQTAIEVSNASGKAQIPYFEGVILGDFYFNGEVINKQPKVHVASATTTLNKVENEFWDIAKADNTVKMYQTYLNQYPNGLYSVLAKIKINQLKPDTLSKLEAKKLLVGNTMKGKHLKKKFQFTMYLDKNGSIKETRKNSSSNYVGTWQFSDDGALCFLLWNESSSKPKYSITEHCRRIKKNNIGNYSLIKENDKAVRKFKVIHGEKLYHSNMFKFY